MPFLRTKKARLNFKSNKRSSEKRCFSTRNSRSVKMCAPMWTNFLRRNKAWFQGWSPKILTSSSKVSRKWSISYSKFRKKSSLVTRKAKSCLNACLPSWGPTSIVLNWHSVKICIPPCCMPGSSILSLMWTTTLLIYWKDTRLYKLTPKGRCTKMYTTPFCITMTLKILMNLLYCVNFRWTSL